MKTFLIALLVLVIAGAGIGYYMFNKKVEGLENKKADYSLSSDELFDSFEQDEAAAQKKYVGKIVEVRGEIVAMNLTDSLPTVTLKAENSMIGGVNCTFTSKIKEVQKAQQLSVKCICQGYLMDVVLNNCIIIED